MEAAKTIERAAEQSAIDTVCGMNVSPNKRGLVASYKGTMQLFCAESFRTDFIKDPVKYLGTKPAKKKGWLGRRLERMAKSNTEHFGGGRPSCH